MKTVPFRFFFYFSFRVALVRVVLRDCSLVFEAADPLEKDKLAIVSPLHFLMSSVTSRSDGSRTAAAAAAKQ